ncbi:VanZ family protein [Chitinimonas sp. JJ19]|uniref:VanZ family protein n=1 Tax=Chitinimonas sp. JJ19 TaxID=3109352 RepID=UPI0030026F20
MRWQLPISYLARDAMPSWLGRHFLLAWHAVILVTSWYPFSGWRYTGEPIWAFLAYPLPHYHTVADNALNLLAYLPLGYAWALYFRCRWFAPLAALVFGATLSGSVEFVQQFLPQRVPSNLDLIYNTAGSLIGALLAGLFSKLLILRGWHVFRQQWFREGSQADYGLILLLLWFISQLNPAVPLFGVVVQPVGLPQPWVSPIENALLFLRGLEAFGVMLSLMGVSLIVVTLLAHRRRAMVAIVGLILLSLLLKVLFAGALLKPDEFLTWFNINVLTGGVLGLGLLFLLLRLKRRWQALVALLCVGLTQMVEAMWPLTAQPYGMLSLFRWRYGLRDFNGLTQTLSEVWPWLATVYLIWLMVRDYRRSVQPTVLSR